MTKALRTQLLVAFMCVALLVYFALLGRVAVAMIASGRAAAVGLGLAVLVMPVIGLWAMVATLRAGFAHQRLARLIAADGMELTPATCRAAVGPHPARRGRRAVRHGAHRSGRPPRRLAALVPAGPRL